MELLVKVADPLQENSPALVVGCCEGELQEKQFAKLNKSIGGALTILQVQQEFSGKIGTTKLLHTLGCLPAARLLLVGLGPREGLTSDIFRQAAGTAARVLASAGLDRCCSVLQQSGLVEDEAIKAVAEGFWLGGYTFDSYKSKKKEQPGLQETTLLVQTERRRQQVTDLLDQVRKICSAVSFARDLVSQPANVAIPSYLADQALAISGSHGIGCHILAEDQLEELGMAALLAVGKGSHNPPRLIVLEYQGGEKQARPVVLVGKGITFDSGGISLKPREGMERMKDDMAGGAAVMATVQAAAALRLPVNLIGLVAAAENLPGGGAYKPGDVIRSMSGKTIEIVNTDAEGRMVLCDALHYAQRYKPLVLIDLATLTGACVVALGYEATGLMGNNATLKRFLRKAGDICGERLWELPLWEEYGELMKSDIADLKNAGGATAGTITAGWFLQQFVAKTNWAHLDIAGTAWEEKGRGYLPKGATGVGVRLLVEYLRGVARG